MFGEIHGLAAPEVDRPDATPVIVLLGPFFSRVEMTACRKLKDLRRGGSPINILRIAIPIFFANPGIAITHVFFLASKRASTLGTDVPSSIFRAAAPDIALPAVRRLAIPEPSPTRRGLTGSSNGTIGISMDIEIARSLKKASPVT